MTLSQLISYIERAKQRHNFKEFAIKKA